jgi:dUTP pyrophosphatase
MESVRVPITPLRPGVELPAYQSAGAAGMDLAAAIDEAVEIPAGEHRLVPCGFAIAVPRGFEAQVRPRSGLAASRGVTVLNAPGTIDSDYRGEVKVILINHGMAAFTVAPGMRIAQLIVSPVAHVTWSEVNALPESDRGEGGFGHTGH